MTELRGPRLAKKARLRWDARGKTWLLVYPERGLALSESAASIVQMCDGTRTAEAIAEALEAPLEDVVAFVNELSSRALLEIAPAPAAALAPAPALALAPAPAPDLPRPYTLIAELTYRCPLRCPYCSNPTDLAKHSGELTTAEWSRVFGEAEALGVVQLHLTGGEPLARRDLEALVSRARALGLYTNLITSGIPLTKARLGALRDAGLDNVQLSVQDADTARGDLIAGYAAMEQKLEVARWVKELDLPLTMNVVLHRKNLDHVAALVALAERIGADRLELANTQYHGWALANREALMPTRTQIDAGAKVAAAAKARLAGTMEVLYVKPDYFGTTPRACMDGWARRFLHMAPTGMVLPCHAAASLTGLRFENARERSLDWIWNESPSFAAFRGEAWMQEPCKSCDRRAIDFGGCRCQAFALTGDASQADPACSLSRHHALVARARDAREDRHYLYRGR